MWRREGAGYPTILVAPQHAVFANYTEPLLLSLVGPRPPQHQQHRHGEHHEVQPHQCRGLLPWDGLVPGHLLLPCGHPVLLGHEGEHLQRLWEGSWEGLNIFKEEIFENTLREINILFMK